MNYKQAQALGIPANLPGYLLVGKTIVVERAYTHPLHARIEATEYTEGSPQGSPVYLQISAKEAWDANSSTRLPVKWVEINQNGKGFLIMEVTGYQDDTKRRQPISNIWVVEG